MMKLHYSPTSPYVRKVLLLAHETDQMETIEFVSSNPIADEDFRKINPLSKVPALEYDDNKPALFESLAICDYLDRQHDRAAFLPLEGDERTAVMYLHSLGQGIMDTAVSLRFQQIREEKLGHDLPKDWWHDRHYDALNAALDILEKDIALLSGPLNLGVITVAAALPFMDFRFPDFEWRLTRPKLDAWFKEFNQRPSMIATAIPKG